MIDIVAMLFGLIGSLILSCKSFQHNKKEIATFSFFLIADVLWLIYGLLIISIGLIVLNIAYVLIGIRAMVINIKELRKNEDRT